jgi:hypothetical protein
MNANERKSNPLKNEFHLENFLLFLNLFHSRLFAFIRGLSFS